MRRFLARRYDELNRRSNRNGVNYYKAPLVLGSASDDAALFDAKVARLRSIYAWNGPRWGNSDAFSGALYVAHMAYDSGEGSRSRKAFNDALAMLQAQNSDEVFSYGRQLMAQFAEHAAILDALPLSPAEIEAEKQAAIARAQEIAAGKGAQVALDSAAALEAWSAEDEATDQRLAQAMNEGVFGASLAYGIGGSVGSAVLEVGKGIEKGLDPLEWLKIPWIRNLGIGAAVVAGAYIALKRK